MHVRPRSARAALLIAIPAAFVAGAAALAWGTSGAVSAVTAPGPAEFDVLLALAAAVVGWAVLGWLAVALLVSLAAEAWRRAGRLDQVARAITPWALRRLTALLLGVGMVGAPVVLALPAHADRTVATSTQIAQTSDLPADSPALERWTPDRPAPAVVSSVNPGKPPALLVSRPHRGRAVSDHVVVRRGDTLWDIAARALGPDATAAEIAASWPRWHATNRSTIGPDPDLILPGQLLRPPGT